MKSDTPSISTLVIKNFPESVHQRLETQATQPDIGL